ncbi:hypothetical protein N7462_010197 [Penicillium macrosclerotiorum]|uniref:uncharacterized protein n=1 Tax=Penicillium macrosclerotiorum TaxID=303699 RepID=UPI002549587E|nr:uncharacterized protein N7462_010197 [Penicillium macrosclerotiorum]KAJ5669127.1 hypothetical protein N7462_010197 [Penicillium macrosclerotiorum]
MEVPDRAVKFVPCKSGDIITLGTMKLRVMEDGSNTDMRMSCCELTIPAGTIGPPTHWHEMHDETFLVTKGMVRFHIPGKPDIDAKVGDYVVVPTKSPHTFSNPTEEESAFFNTFTPAFYINYFKLLGELVEGGSLTKEANEKAMAYYATIPVPEP